MRGVLISLLMLAHSWYPQECCGGSHCYPVDCKDMHKIKGGWQWKEFTFEQGQPSGDGGCHICTLSGEPICLFFGGTA